MTVTKVDSGDSGAPALWSYDTPGQGAAIMAWALPQLGWTLTIDEASTTGRVAITNADGATFAFFDDDTLPENQQDNDQRNNNMRVLIYEGFVDFATRGAGTPIDFGRGNGIHYRHTDTTEQSTPTEAGYTIWGDEKTAVIKLWYNDNENEKNKFVRSRYYIYYIGRVDSIVAGETNQVVLGSKDWGYKYGEDNNLFGIRKSGRFRMLRDHAGTTGGIDQYFWQAGLTSGNDSYLGTNGIATNPFTGDRAISRPWLADDTNGDPRYALRGLYVPVGEWSTIMDSIDEGVTPSLTVDVGDRVLKVLNGEHGYGNDNFYESHRWLLDDQGPWS